MSKVEGDRVSQPFLGIFLNRPSTTVNVYTHLWEAEEDRTADMMEAALSDVP